MIDFIKLVENILEEQGKSKQSLFEDCVVSANTFFKYRQRYPSLKTVIKIANYLNVSIDYLFEFVYSSLEKRHTTNRSKIVRNDTIFWLLY